MIVREYWATTAEYYDSFHSNRQEDVEFWTDVACRIGGPVLEIGCGTGRVGLEIARSGLEIHGVDQSEVILDVFRHKLSVEPEDVQRRVRLHSGDMRTFDLGQQFHQALIPFRPLQYMLTLEDQLAALNNARRHLTEGGILGFDVFFPKFSLFDEPDGVEKAEREWVDREGRTVRRFVLRHRVQSKSDNLRLLHFPDLRRNGVDQRRNITAQHELLHVSAVAVAAEADQLRAVRGVRLIRTRANQ